MKGFKFTRPQDVEGVSAALASGNATLKANGVDLLDMMKERVVEPTNVVSLIDVPKINDIVIQDYGAVRIGAMATLHDLAHSDTIKTLWPALAGAAEGAASLQLRTRATVGGNLGQHPRCGYFRHESMPCLRRGGTTCPVREEGGVQEGAGVFNNSTCASAHPSSLAPVFGALDTTAQIVGPKGRRELDFAELWATPAAGTMSDLSLAQGEWIESVRIPAYPDLPALAYEEVRQMAAFDWALASCAVRLDYGKLPSSDDKKPVRQARVWFGSLAPTPMRSQAAEAELTDKPLTEKTIEAAVEAAVKSATPLAGNRHKVQLARVVLRRALMKAGGVK